MPAAVAREILARGPSDVTAATLASSTWLKQVDDPACQAAVQTQSAIARTSVLHNLGLGGF